MSTTTKSPKGQAKEITLSKTGASYSRPSVEEQESIIKKIKPFVGGSPKEIDKFSIYSVRVSYGTTLITFTHKSSVISRLSYNKRYSSEQLKKNLSAVRSVVEQEIADKNADKDYRKIIKSAMKGTCMKIDEYSDFTTKVLDDDDFISISNTKEVEVDVEINTKNISEFEISGSIVITVKDNKIVDAKLDTTQKLELRKFLAEDFGKPMIIEVLKFKNEVIDMTEKINAKITQVENDLNTIKSRLISK